MKNYSAESCRENQNTFYIQTLFFVEIRVVYENNMEKYGTDGEATDDNMAHTHCMPGT
jgi:hypothetical protein